MAKVKNFKHKIGFIVSANDVDTAKEIYSRSNGSATVELLVDKYDDIKSAINEIKKYHSALNGQISIGFSEGDSSQWMKVAKISKSLQPFHINQVFTGVGYNRAIIEDEETIINGLVIPSGTIGYVRINTGPESSQYDDAVVPVETALSMIRDMGGNSLKLYPISSIKNISEYRYIARVCAREEFILEPAGGINIINFRKYAEIAIEEGVTKLLMHVHNAIVNPVTKKINIGDLHMLMRIVEEFE